MSKPQGPDALTEAANSSQEATALIERRLDALRRGDHREALSLSRSLRLIYLDL